jgi:hypothetical protein
MGAVAWAIRRRSVSQSPLIEPDVPVSGIRLSDWFHREAHGVVRATRGSCAACSDPSGYPAEPLVSYQINRQLSGWNLPPQAIRAFGAHSQWRTLNLDNPTLAAELSSTAPE